MKLVDLCIRRPVFTTMLIASWWCSACSPTGGWPSTCSRTSTSRSSSSPRTLKGASVEEMETGVTKPIEEAVNTIEGIDELRSIDQRGRVARSSSCSCWNEPRGGGAGRARQGGGRPAPAAARHRPAGRREVRRRRVADPEHRRLGQAQSARGHRDRPQGRSRKTSRPSAASARSRWSAASSGRSTSTSTPTGSPPTRSRSSRCRRRCARRTSSSPAAASTRAARNSCCARWAASPRVDDFKRPDRRQRAQGRPIRIGDVGRVDDAVVEPRSLARLDGEPGGVAGRPQADRHQHRRGHRPVKKRLARTHARPAAGHLRSRSCATSRASSRSRSTRCSSTWSWPASWSPDGPAVHRQPARHADRRGRHPDLDHLHVHADDAPRLHAQQHHHAGAGAGRRHRHRRRRRGAREHLPAHGGEGRSRRCRRRRRRRGRSASPSWRRPCRWS